VLLLPRHGFDAKRSESEAPLPFIAPRSSGVDLEQPLHDEEVARIRAALLSSTPLERFEEALPADEECESGLYRTAARAPLPVTPTIR